MALNLRQSAYVNLSHLNSVATKKESPCLGQNKVSKLCTCLRFLPSLGILQGDWRDGTVGEARPQ